MRRAYRASLPRQSNSYCFFNVQGEKEFGFSLFDKEEEPVPVGKVTLELAPNSVYYLEISGDSLEEAEVEYKE